MSNITWKTVDIDVPLVKQLATLFLVTHVAHAPGKQITIPTENEIPDGDNDHVLQFGIDQDTREMHVRLVKPDGSNS